LKPHFKPVTKKPQVHVMKKQITPKHIAPVGRKVFHPVVKQKR